MVLPPLFRLLLTLGVISCLGCRPADEPETLNVILVMIDTLRADHLSAYGYERSTSPGMESLNREAFRFDNHYSQSGCTFPSVNSIFTSRYPQGLMGRGVEGWSIPDELLTVAEALSDLGYSTAAVSASQIVRATPSSRNKKGGFDAGFEVFDETCELDAADCVLGRGKEIATDLSSPYFLYLHFMDPHHPYITPPSHERRFATRPAQLRSLSEQGSIWRWIKQLYDDKGPFEPDSRDRQDLVDHYDEGIAYIDSVLMDLGRWADAERALVIVASDHGEELLDHGALSHCRDLAWNSVIRTPMWVRLPGEEAEKRTKGDWSGVTQNIDIFPTILDYVCERLPKGRCGQLELAGLHGRSLRPAIERDRPVHRYAFSIQGASRAVMTDRWKLLRDLRTGEQSLFDLTSDPGEMVDLSAESPEVLTELSQVLDQWIERNEGEGESAVETADEVEERLKALGYL